MVLGALALVLLSSGGLKALQTASIVGALPFVLVIYGLLAALIRALVKERAAVAT
ncbi:MAG: BCCT family transporter [Desulfopila sp.]